MRLRLALPSLALALAGCISSNNSSPGEDGGTLPTEDSGTQPGVDATVNDSSSPGTDSSVDSAPSNVDAGVDAGTMVTMLVANDLGPEPGVLVLFHDSTGAVVGSATTGANGTVSAPLAANSQVTAVFSGPNGMALTTIQGVQPGDQLTALDSTNLAFTGSTVTVDLPDATAPAGAVYYGAHIGSCATNNAQSSPITVTGVAFPCELQDKFPTLLTATSSGGQEVGYSYVDDNSLPLDGGPVEVVPVVGWLTDETTPSVFLANPPPTLSDGGGYGAYQVQYEEISGNVPYTTTSIFATLQADGGLAGLAFTGHPSYPDSLQIEGTARASSYDSTRNTYIQQLAAVVTRGGPDGGSLVSIDMSQELPELVTAQINANDAGTASQPVITWTSLGSLASTDGIVVVAFFSLDLADGGVVDSVPWSIVLPPSATSATPPALPASVGTPVVNGSAQVVPTVMAVEASYLAGYAQMREAAGSLVPTVNEFRPNQALFTNYGNGPIAPTLPVDGTLRLTAVTLCGD